MRFRALSRGKISAETGAALLIAIFTLMLISVVAIALIVSSGTDTALAGNYRNASSAYYASLAGLEEARGRLLWKNPDFVNKTGGYTGILFDASGVVPAWSLTQVLYITNPASGETVNPTSANAANYPDTEYSQEFPSWGLGGATVTQIPSVSPVASASLPGPSYKWVRINPITEQSLNVDVNGDGVQDSAAVLYYDPAHLDASGNPSPSLVLSSPPGSPPTPSSVQVLELTALAVLPSGSTRLLQYVVSPVMISPDLGDISFPGGLTLDGNGVNINLPSTYQIVGTDACNPPPASAYSIAYSNPADFTPIQTEVNPNKSNYPGAPMTPPPPSYSPTTPALAPPGQAPTLLRQSWLTPKSLDAVVQDITNAADVVIPGPATSTDIANRAPNMSPSNPMTIVVNGDLTVNRINGYGLLLVTGNFIYDPDTNWTGIVLVIGQGTFFSSKGGLGGFTGAMLLAKTRDGSGNLLPGPSLGSTSFVVTNPRPGFGIAYSSCAIKSAQGPLIYKVLSFHEIPTT